MSLTNLVLDGPLAVLSLVRPRRHKILIELANPIHPIDQGTIQVTVPAAKPQPEAH